MKKRVKSLLLVVCLLVATMAVAVAGASGKKSGSEGPIVLYRNPVVDFIMMTEDEAELAADNIGEMSDPTKVADVLNDFTTKFHLSEETKKAWKKQLNTDEIYFYEDLLFNDFVSVDGTAVIPNVDVDEYLEDFPFFTDEMVEELLKKLSIEPGHFLGTRAVWRGSEEVKVKTSKDGAEFPVTIKSSANLVFDVDIDGNTADSRDVEIKFTSDKKSADQLFAEKYGKTVTEYVSELESKIAAKAAAIDAETDGNVTYDFKGWDTNNDGEADLAPGEIATAAFGKKIDVTTIGALDVTYKAIIDVKKVAYEFVWADELRGEEESATIVYGEPVVNPIKKDNSANYVAGEKYTIDGTDYYFDGWTYGDSKSLDVAYLQNVAISSSNEIKVDAQYTEIIPGVEYCSVTYQLLVDGEKEWDTTLQVVKGTNASSTVVCPTNPSYVVDDTVWMNGTVPYDFTQSVNGPLTLTKNATSQFTVKYDLNYDEKGLFEEYKGLRKGTSITVPTTVDHLRSGFEFIGWGLASNATDVVKENYTVNSDVTFYAIWEEYPTYIVDTTVKDTAVEKLIGSFKDDALAELFGVKVVIKDKKTNVEVADNSELYGYVDTTVSGYNSNLGCGTFSVLVSTKLNESYVLDTAKAKFEIAAPFKVDLTVTQGVADVSILSQVVRFGEKVTDPFEANCDTIDIIAGVDVADASYLKGRAQVAMPGLLYDIVEIVAEDQGKKLDKLTIKELRELIESIDAEGQPAIENMLSAYYDNEESIDKLVTTLEKIQAIIPVKNDILISIVKDAVEIPDNIGVYVMATIASDASYTDATDAGYLVITPDGTRAELSWNKNDSNKIITVENVDSFDFGATAKVNGKENSAVQKHVGHLFVGVDKDLTPYYYLGKDANGAELSVGVYGQVAFVADWGNEMYYAEPIARPVIISPKAADVQILDKNGNENHIQLHTYNGKPVELKVTVNGIVPTSGLKVKYIGMDTTVDGWYRSEAPTDAGVYAVVALYTEYEDGELTTAGGNLGVLVIKPADTETVLDDDRYCPNTGEHFAKLANGKFDYLTLAIDKANNIYYVNVPEDFGPQLKALIEKLPYELETYVLDKIGQYLDFEGDVKISTITKALQDVAAKIDSVDKVQFVDEKTDVILDKLINKIRSSEKLDELLIKFESKLKDAIEKVGNKVDNKLGEDISEKLYAYVDSVLDVDGSGVDVDTAKIKDDLYEYLAKLGKKLPSDKYAELKGIVDEIVNLVETEVRPEEIEDLISQLIVYLNDFNSEDAKELIEKAYNYTFDRVDETVVYKYLDGIVETAAGYADKYSMGDHVRQIYAYAKQIYERDYSAVPKLEEYIDGLLVSLTDKLAENAPTGTIVFGSNPKDEGTYACYAINVSANYMPSLDDATLTIGCEIDENVWEKSYDYKGDRKATCTEKEIYHMVWRCIHCKEIAKVSERGYYGGYAPHKWAEVVDAKYLKTAANCTDAAVYYKSCSVCKVAGTDTFTSGEALGHKWAEVVDAKYLKTAANCTDAAVYYKSCSVCKVAGTDTFTSGEALGHKWAEVVDAKYLKTAANCTDAAVYYKSCSVCKVAGTDTFTSGEALGHKWAEIVDAKYLKTAATCTEKAVYYKSCSVCGEKGTETFTVDGLAAHQWAEVVADKYLKSAATCTEKAVYYKSCSVCGEKGTETFTVDGLAAHQWAEVVADKYLKSAATCTEKAVYYKSCSVCGEKGTETFTVDGLAAHQWAEVVADKYLKSAATCTEKAVYYKSCSVCGEKGTETFTVDGLAAHQWAEVVADKYLKSAATCTEKAVYYKSCSVCGEKGTETFTVDGLAAHKEGNFVLEKCACPENGEQDKVWYCTECGVELRREHVKKDTPVIPEDPKPEDPKDPEDPKPEDPKDPVKPDSPVTADNNNMFVWFAAMLVSVAGVVLAFFKKRSYR